MCGNIFIINLHVLFTSLYFPLMNSKSLSLYDDILYLPLSVNNLLNCSINFLLLVLSQFISRDYFPFFLILWLQS